VNRDDIIRMAGHREVPPWVMKLVIDCVEAEREACAKMFDGDVWAYDYREIAAAIRARGER
jgi:hypothetical protein